MYKTALTLAVFALASCAQKKSDDGAAAKVEGYQTTSNGLQYKIIADNPGEPLKAGQYCLSTSTLRTLDGALVDIPDHTKSGYSQVSQPRYKGDPLEVLMNLSEGDSASVIVNEKTFLADYPQRPSNVKEGDQLRMDIKLMKVYTAEQYATEVIPQLNAAKYANETKQIDDYIAAQGWTAVSLPSGLKIVVDKQGNGAPVTDGALIKVNYTGKLLNGTVFDSNVLPEFNHVQPFELTVGKGMVIKGWDEGLKSFHQGGKGKLIIPARLGYGEQGSGKIPPNSPLMFEVEILEVKPSA